MLETIPEGCTCSMFQNRNLFNRRYLYNRLFY
nr:MAG TPA: Nrap protein domain 1 [Caudoviricetes sp.]